ncbi:uncharacterized protein [Apostichopus japonicus]|uniref:uncharacterized protein isoform X2 n=1 Tax=Stichopus japonicus TaxID=307972 RepID=UPI003AB22DCB
MAAHILEISLLVICLFSAGNTIQCTRRNYALIGNNVSMDCNLENFYEVYWYKDKTSSSTPLVKIVGGKKTVPTLEEGHYDINDNGALIIYDVKTEDYGHYTILCVYPDDAFVEDIVQLDAAIQPHQSCPAITNCSSCQCVSAPNEIHNVTCIINNARPLVNLGLLLETVVNYTVLFREEGVTYDNSSDTWNSRAMIVVLIPNCDTTIRLRCTVIGENDFSVSDSILELTSDRCFVSATPTVSLEHSVLTFFEDHWLFAVIVALSLIVLCTFVVICFAIKRNLRKDNSKNEHQGNDTELSATEPLLTHSSPLSEEQMDKLMNHLQYQYLSMSYIKPVPWGKKVLIDELYAEAIFNVTYPESPTEIKTSNSLLDPKYSQNIKRALFIADIGHGKTTLCQYLACQWSKKELNEKKKEMLFILPLTGIDINAGIGKQLHETLPGDVNIPIEQLCDIILKRKCHLLLDGLDEISQHENTPPDVSPSDISLKRLLNESNLNQYPDLRLWVTSRKIDQSKCIYEHVYVKVEMLGFNTEEIETYVGKTIEYYKRIKPCQTKTLHNDCLANAARSKQKEQGKDEIYADLREKTIYTLNQNDLVTDFKDTPLFIVMFIHIIVSKLLNIKVSFFELNINKMSSLVSSVITCLDRSFLEKHGNEAILSALPPLRMELAKASLNYDINESIKNFDLNETRLQAHRIEMAKSIGYIKPIKSLQNVGVSQCDYNMFSHDYIQEFCIAEYIVSGDLVASKKFLSALEANKTEENIRISRILRFICGISNKMRDETLKHLLETRRWNTLADCIYESENDEDILDMKNNEDSVKQFSLLLKNTSHIAMKVVRLDERYHQNSFKLFIGKCLRSNVSNGFAIFLTHVLSVTNKSPNAHSVPNL